MTVWSFSDENKKLVQRWSLASSSCGLRSCPLSFTIRQLITVSFYLDWTGISPCLFLCVLFSTSAQYHIFQEWAYKRKKHFFLVKGEKKKRKEEEVHGREKLFFSWNTWRARSYLLFNRGGPFFSPLLHLPVFIQLFLSHLGILSSSVPPAVGMPTKKKTWKKKNWATLEDDSLAYFLARAWTRKALLACYTHKLLLTCLEEEVIPPRSKFFLST